MAKKQSPPGVASAEEVWTIGKELPDRERAFLYGLWLTGARTAELCQLKTQDIYQKEGEWWFRLPVLKWKKAKVPYRTWPLNLLGDPLDARMEGVFVTYVQNRTTALVFDYTRYVRTLKWKGKNGELRERQLPIWVGPYYYLVKKEHLTARMNGESGTVERTLPPHFVRTSSITAKAERLPQDPTFVKEWVKHASYDTTLKYIQMTEWSKLNRLKAARMAQPELNPPDNPPSSPSP
jgi:integrase